MDKNAAISAILKFRRSLEKNGITIKKLILFGSYASGSQHDGSDIDVVVVSDDFNNLGYWQRIDILSHAIYEVWEPIEATAYTSDEWEAGNTTIGEFAKNGEWIGTNAG